MPPPAKVLRPPAPATAQPLVELTTAPTTSGAPARPTAGNAAVAAALGGTWPPGQVERMLAGQGLVGNAATAALGGRTGILPALPGTAPPAPAPAVPAPPAPSRTVPAPAGRAEPEPAAPGTKKPETKKPAEPKPGAIKAKPPPVPVPGVKEKDGAPQPAKEKGGGKAAATARRSPGADPKFQALKKDVGAKKRAVGSSHPPASTEATAAQAAAVPPADDQEARGKAAHAEDMDAAEPKEFDKEAFVRAVEKAISDRAPKNLDEADGFGESGKAEEVKAEVQGKVGEGKDTAAEDIASTTAQPPEPAPDDKPVTPLSPDQPPGRPGGPDPGQAVPDKLPSSATDMSAGPEQVDRQMADAQVTETQLAKSNEPAFTGALTEKKSMEAHSATAPGELRGAEGQEIKQGRAAAAATGPKAMGAIHATRVSTGKQVGAGKGKAKGSDEEKRATVTALLQKVFDQTKTDVEKILKDLDKAVDDQFTAGEKQARTRFVLEHTTGMRRYKAERYGGWDGPFLWGRDLFKGLPDEANQIYERAKANYLTAMRQVIRDIAGTVERELRRAKDRIAEGRTQLATAVDQLPKDLKAIGQEAATDFAAKFDELKDTVDDKGTELVDTLATRYTDAVKEIDKLIAAEKEKNKGLVDKVVDAVKGVINTIIELKNMLMGVLRKAVQAIGLILRDPIGFLGNLVKAVGGGLKLFMKNIGRHLQQGVLGWLLGTASSAGIQIPAKFDVRGVLQIITGLLGLTKENVLTRISRKTSPRAVAAVEKSVPVLAQVKRQGVMGMWDDLKSHVGDLKKNLIDNLIKYLTPTIVIAGITWILSLLNPASAFVRAVKMIIDIVRFIITQGRQIIAFVNAVLDAVIAIAGGGGGGVPAMVEGALARSIPILIGALAAILGIGGIAGKVRQIFQQMSRPVNRAIDQVVDKIAGLIKRLWAKLKPKPAKKKPKKQKRPTRPKSRTRYRRPRERRKDRRRNEERHRRPSPTPRKPQDDKDPKQAKKPVPLPVVEVPFALAGKPHSLTFTPRGPNADITMASKRGMPLADKFKEVHWALSHLDAYIDTIQDEAVKQAYKEKFETRMGEMATIDVKSYKVIYKQVFPHRELEERALTATQRRRAQDVQQLVERANALLADIITWAGQLGIPDLSREAIEETINVKGKEIWEKRYQEIKTKVDDILKNFKYKGQDLHYVGSMSRGWRGPHKGFTRFNLKDFDVDLYVVDPQEFERLERVGAHRNNPDIMDKDKVFPTIEDTPTLFRISNAVRAALEAAFPPPITGISDSTIVLRKSAP